MARKAEEPVDPHHITQLLQAICATRQYGIYTRNWANFQRQWDLEALYREITNMHATRYVRGWDSNDMIAHGRVRLLDANGQNQAFRSRLVEIDNHLLVYYTDMEELQEAFWEWAAAAFAQELHALGLRTESQQWAAVGKVVADMTKRMKRVNLLRTLVASILKDIDAAGFTLVRTKQALEMDLDNQYAK